MPPSKRLRAAALPPLKTSPSLCFPARIDEFWGSVGSQVSKARPGAPLVVESLHSQEPGAATRTSISRIFRLRLITDERLSTPPRKGIGALGETKHQREHEDWKSPEGRDRRSDHHKFREDHEADSRAGDWRGETLSHVRQLIHEADPGIEEEWKWAKPKSPGTPVWSHDGIVCTGESYKQVVKLTFARGASITDPKKLFNSSLKGTRGVQSTSAKGRYRRSCLQATHPRRRGGQFRSARSKTCDGGTWKK